MRILRCLKPQVFSVSLTVFLLAASPLQNLLRASCLPNSYAYPPGTVLLNENFDELTPAFTQTSVGAFSAINGTNVDIYTPAGYANPCNGPESGHCVDMNGTGGNPQGQLQSNQVFQPGDYLLSFDLIGSERQTTASVTVSMGDYNHTFTLTPQDFTSGIVTNVPVTVTTPTHLLFTGDPNTGVIGLFLDNVVVKTTGTPLIVTHSQTPCKAGKAYSSISSAVAAAEAGSYIYVCPGTYAEQVVIQKSLYLIGVNTGGNGESIGFTYPVMVSPTGGLAPLRLANGQKVYPISSSLRDGKPMAAQIAAVGAGPVQISGILFNGYQNDPGSYNAHAAGIYYQNASGEISGDIVLKQMYPSAASQETGFGIFTESGCPQAAQGGAAGSSSVSILGNTVDDFQTVAIAAGGSATTATVSGNSTGLTAQNMSTAPNAIQFVGATGKISGNYLVNVNSGSGYGSVGIFLVGSSGVTVQGNLATAVDVPILTWSDVANGTAAADSNTITNNILSGTGFDGASGIEACSNFNTITSNNISRNANGGVHANSFCPGSVGTADATSGSGNSIENNTISQTCAGIPVGGNSNTVAFNLVVNAKYAFWSGDQCGSANSQAPVGNSNMFNTLGGTVPATDAGDHFVPATRTKRHF
jgi:hypothetical protein